MQTPDRKVGAGALAGALSIILIFVFGLIWPTTEIPPEVASAFTVVLTFITSYFVRQ